MSENKEQDKMSPKIFIESILKRGIDWYDYKKLDAAQWNAYYNDTQFISQNQTFNNELNHYITDLVKFCATLEGTPLSSDKLIQLTNVQFGIVVLETFKKRLEEIENPSKQKLKEEPFSVL